MIDNGFDLFLDDFAYPWDNECGEDDYGLWMAFVYQGVRHAFRWIMPGRFLMGSPEDEEQRDLDETQHEVILTQGFWLADSACTQALWEAVMGENPSGFKGADRPVENVSWEQTQVFIERLNRELPGLDLRLPSEAEWEYACRAGTGTPFWFGDNIIPEQANYEGNYPYAGGSKGRYQGHTVEVKALPCNDWGLYQMHGNVWEWCHDWYAEYPESQQLDPLGAAANEGRVRRGGGWYSGAGHLRSSYRSRGQPGGCSVCTGFRLARGRTAPTASQCRVRRGGG